jgi:hypothetical protein
MACLTLNDDGTLGRPHSGEASLAGQLFGSLTDGTFQLIGRTLLAEVKGHGGSEKLVMARERRP